MPHVNLCTVLAIGEADADLPERHLTAFLPGIFHAYRVPYLPTMNQLDTE